MRKLLIAAVATLPLVGCVTTDLTIRKYFTQVCDTMEIGWQGVIAFNAAGVPIPANLLIPATKAHDEAARLCASDPATVNTTQVALTIIKLTAIITNALIQAQKAEAAIEQAKSE